MILLFSYYINKLQMDLTRKMNRTEFKDLSDVDKKERKRLQRLKASKKHREENPEKYKEINRKYRENNPEKIKERKRKYYEENLEKEKKRGKKYREENPEKDKERHRKYKQTSAGKKVNTLSQWKKYGLLESDEDLEWIYELYLTQELCYSCDCILTRNGDNSKDQACMDHCHITNKFRQICCRSCNSNDNWMKYWC